MMAWDVYIIYNRVFHPNFGSESNKSVIVMVNSWINRKPLVYKYLISSTDLKYELETLQIKVLIYLRFIKFTKYTILYEKGHFL